MNHQGQHFARFLDANPLHPHYQAIAVIFIAAAAPCLEGRNPDSNERFVLDVIDMDIGTGETTPLSFKGHTVKAFAHWTSGTDESHPLRIINVVVGIKSKVIYGPWESNEAAIEAVLKAADEILDASPHAGHALSR